MILLEFGVVFALIFLFLYLIPAGSFYYVFYVRQDEETRRSKIQTRSPKPGDVRREFRLSVLSVAIFAALTTLLLQWYKLGGTKLYWDPHAYPLWYLPLSLLICLVVHDTYFYWTHRFMHWRRVFKYTHLGHHRSITPTPWAIYAFQPLEAVIQYGIIATLVLWVPLHPVVLAAYLVYDAIVNTAGHAGHELVPRALSRHWLFKWGNTVTHHDLHHTNTKRNFGAFFNIWDRWMGTFLDDDQVTSDATRTAD